MYGADWFFVVMIVLEIVITAYCWYKNRQHDKEIRDKHKRQD